MSTALLASSDCSWAVALAASWARLGDRVTLVLLDGAAAAARRGHAEAGAIGSLQRAGVRVIVHADALRRRGITASRRVDGVEAVDLDAIAELVTDGAERVMWL